MRQNLNCGKLFRDDLDCILRNEDDADYAFSLFDLDGDGYVVEEEVHSRFQKIYRCVPQTKADCSCRSGRGACC